MYKPQPIDTSSQSLPDEIRDLMELLAKNAHEVWAAQRISDGWSYGPVRDESGRRHPCLVPYENLPEEEKRYDRILAENTLRLIQHFGYRIEKRPG